MNSRQIFVLALIIFAVSATFTNTTDFWKEKLETATMHYECYSDINLLIQVTKKLIGTIQKEQQECTTVYLQLMGIVLLFLLQEYPSSFGFKEDQEVVLSSAHSPN